MKKNYSLTFKLLLLIILATFMMVYTHRDDYLQKASQLMEKSSVAQIESDTMTVEQLIPEPEPESVDLSGGLLAYYPFINGAQDESPTNPFHGKVHQLELTADRFNIPDNAFRFPGNRKAYIELPDSILKKIVNTVSATAWIFPEDFQYIRGIASQGGRWTMALNKLRLEARVYKYPRGEKSVYSSRNIPNSQWSFVAMTYDGSFLRIYMNGDLCGTTKMVADSLGCQGFRLFGKPAIGHGTGVDGKNFLGAIDDVYIYNKALNKAEIKMIYDTSKPQGL